MVIANERDATWAGPLDGMLVVDASSIIAGPLCGAMLRMFGARVIKIEHPDLGDAARTMGPPGAEASFWTFLSQDKECVSCRLSDPRGAALVKRMIEHADVFIESFRPGTLEKWGLGPTELKSINPDLVIVRVSGFGQDGPYRDRPGYGTLAEAMAGFAHVTGEADGPPTLPGFPVADSVSGMVAAVACMAALLGKERDTRRRDRGAVIDVSLFESLAYFLSPLLVEYQLLGTAPERRGNRAFGVAPRNAARCADGRWVAYSVQSPSLIDKLIDFLDLRRDPAFADAATARSNGEQLDQILVRWISERSREGVLEQLVAADIPVAPVNDSADILGDSHLLERGSVVTLAADVAGEVRLLAPPAGLDGWRRQPSAAGFAIGRHNESVFGDWLGLSPGELAELAEAGVI